ncbi:MAG TPA: hypothetical protein VL096_16145, partial [Pirellulaceae bacterium]|nr:hypothetical protein [Pirellulaceae bacterium]
MGAIGSAWWLATALLLAPPVDGPTSAQISQAIAELGSDDYHTRERATEWLWIAGSVAEPALRSALSTDDAEIQFRAGTVLEKFRLGIHPGISPVVATLIMQYRGTELRQKQLAVQQLREMQEWKVLLRLLQSETNANYRRALSSTLRDETARQVTLKLNQGEFDEAREYLEFDSALGNAMSQRQLAMFLVLRGGIDESVKTLLAIPERTPEQTELLVVLLRAQGNQVAVRELVDKRGNATESLALAVEQQRYADAAQLLVGSVLKDKPTPTTEDVGNAASYFRLVGDEVRYQERLNQLRALADDEGVDPWNVYKVLLLHGHTAEAIELLKAIRPAMALELLAARQQYEEAFAVANIAATTEFDQAWYDKLPVGKQISDPYQKRVSQSQLALRAGYFLHTLGEVDRAQA